MMKRLLYRLFVDVVGKLNASINVENVTTSSVRIHYSIQLDVSDLTFNIHYNSTTTHLTHSSADFTKLSDIKMLTDLSPNTEYVLWITAKASDGISVSSESLTFKTQFIRKLIYSCVGKYHVRKSMLLL